MEIFFICPLDITLCKLVNINEIIRVWYVKFSICKLFEMRVWWGRHERAYKLHIANFLSMLKNGLYDFYVIRKNSLLHVKFWAKHLYLNTVLWMHIGDVKIKFHVFVDVFASPGMCVWKELTVSTEQAVGYIPSTELHVRTINTNVANCAGTRVPGVQSVDSHCNDGAIADPKLSVVSWL
jgi:hypothetical protein